ncbi:putative nuclease HARBI1 [Heterodontus francisci]|uniref:putative nuclease HARBI1 n=1 Tax=Heterodontus francisci TaxID=7792 RepID=UPI00355B029F
MGFQEHPMPAALKITGALNIYTSGSFQGSTGDTCGVSQAVACHCIKDVTNALIKRAGDYVCNRTDPDSQSERAIRFVTITGFPRVQGVIDCTLVAIKALMDQPAAFININVQLVCDHQKCFLQVWIFGNKVYLLKTWLLVPVRNPCNAVEECSNNCHGFTRVIIEQAIGLLKMRFCCLLRSGGALQYGPVRVSPIMVVCCAMHYLAVQKGEPYMTMTMPEQHSSTDKEDTGDGEKEVPLDVESLAPEARQNE